MPGISFDYPQLLVLLLLLPLAWRYLTNRRFTLSTALRLGIFCLAVLGLSRPRLAFHSGETDLIVLIDRSDSCAPAAERMLAELSPVLRRGDSPGDRLALIGFGRGVTVERGFDSDAAGRGGDEGFSGASDLAAGLELAKSLRQPERRTAILCLSDGLCTGRDPALVADRASLPVWYRHVGGGDGLDLAAGRITLPESVEPRSAWLVRYEILADAPCEAIFSLSRNRVPIAGGPVALRRGVNRFFARDTAETEGILEYRLEVGVKGDRVRRNNVSRAMLLVRGAPRVLLAAAGGGGFLAKTLAAAAIAVDVAAPGSFPVDAAFLSPYELVVLENCPASSFPPDAAEALASAVESGLTSLLVTGGANSFGNGGYHRSALDRVLPVSMELRNEKRRGAMAVAIAMDRSGSMNMSAEGGRTKMDLANLGAAESIRLLSPADQVAVLAVDTLPHVVVSLSSADAAESLAQLVLGVKSMGGGIYCLSALKASAAELEKSALRNRHIILFADASDAEEQEGCVDFARDLARRGINLSVIAMGAPGDSDAAFLISLARAGGGEALFSSRAEGLPALFTQEIMRVSRRGFIEEPVRPRLLSGLAGMGVDPAYPPPVLEGFNASSPKEGATLLMNLDDEFATPLLATRPAGKGMAGALLFEVDGEFSGSFATWRESPELLVSLVRRLSTRGRMAQVKAYSEERDGEAVVRFELTPEAAGGLRGRTLGVEWLGAGGARFAGKLAWEGPETLVAKTRLSEPGHYLALAELGETGLAPAPAMTFSYGEEYRLRSATEGREALARLARATGGEEGLDVGRIRQSARSEGEGTVELSRIALIFAGLLVLLELSGRRLLWFT